MNKKTIILSFKYIQVFLICAVLFAIPTYPKYAAISLTLLFICSFFGEKSLQFKKLPSLYFLLPVFFGIHVISFFFTDNIDFWLKDLETKLSFLIVPIVFFNLSRSVIKMKDIFVFSFLAGVVVSMILSYQKALACYNIEHARFCWESSSLSYNFHPTYLSLYYIVAIILLIQMAMGKKNQIFSVILSVLLIPPLLFFIYHFYSIGPWISGIGVIIILFLVYFIKKKVVSKFLLSLFVISAVLFVSFSKLDLLTSDFTVIKNELLEYKTSPKDYFEKNKGKTQSVKARIILWSITSQLITEHPFGVGGGDVKDVLIKRYENLGLIEYAEKKLNPHNQFLQTSLALGVGSALFLLCSLVLIIRYGIVENDFLLIAFTSLILISMFFESLWERQAGILSFTFLIYYSLVYTIHKIKYIDKSDLN